MQHATDRAPGIKQNTQFADWVGLDNPDRRVNRAMHSGEGPSSRKAGADQGACRDGWMVAMQSVI
jgi:hypothetical protein